MALRRPSALDAIVSLLTVGKSSRNSPSRQPCDPPPPLSTSVHHRPSPLLPVFPRLPLALRELPLCSQSPPIVSANPSSSSPGVRATSFQRVDLPFLFCLGDSFGFKITKDSSPRAIFLAFSLRRQNSPFPPGSTSTLLVGTTSTVIRSFLNGDLLRLSVPFVFSPRTRSFLTL